MKNGKIVEIHSTPGFGVIAGDDGEKALFRAGAVQSAQFQDLKKNQKVSYQAVESDGLTEATVVTPKAQSSEVGEAIEAAERRGFKTGRVVFVSRKMDAGIIMPLIGESDSVADGPAVSPVRFTSSAVEAAEGATAEMKDLLNNEVRFADKQSAVAGKRIATRVMMESRIGTVTSIRRPLKTGKIDDSVRFHRGAVKPPSAFDSDETMHVGSQVRYEMHSDGEQARSVEVID